ncbi:MAG: hypothetical protein ACTS6J_14765 [Burkholderiales bacterium]
MRGVWAIGDLVGEPMLAHKASAQGHLVAEAIAGTIHQHPALGEAFHEFALRTLGHAIHI